MEPGQWATGCRRSFSGHCLDCVVGEQAVILRGHADDVNAVTWSLDGRRLASASDDRTVKIWDLVTGEEVLTLRGHEGAGTIKIWSATNEDGMLVPSK